jgi:hypothetical protein
MYDDLPHCFARGTYRNSMSELVLEGKVLKFPRECPSRFILSDWRNRPEYRLAFKDDKTPAGGPVKVIGGKMIVDFVSYVESLGWSELAFVHDVRVEFSGFRLKSAEGWERSETNCCWRRRILCVDFPVTAQVYDTGHVQVIVQCSRRPISFDLGGLMRLTSALGELKGLLGFNGVPNVADWIVTSWHYGKDSLKEVSGPAFNVTFETWCSTLGRIYTKKESNRLRVECVQSPKLTLEQLYGTVLNCGGSACPCRSKANLEAENK